MTFKLTFLAVAISVAVVSAELEPVAVIVAQPSAPLLITELEVVPFSAAGSNTGIEGVRWEVDYQNASDRQIVALRVGFVSFNAFNEYMFRFEGYLTKDIDAGRTDDGDWTQRRLGAFAFHTGVVYVDRVRFANGDIWVADLGPVGERLMQVQAGFDLSVLTEEGEL